MKKRIILILLTGLVAFGVLWSVSYRLLNRDNPPLSTASPLVRNPLATAIIAFKVHMGRLPTTEEGLRVLIVAPSKDATLWRGPYLDGSSVDLAKYEYRLDSSSKDGFILKIKASQKGS